MKKTVVKAKGKTKRVTAKKAVKHASHKHSLGRNHAGTGVYWYGVHIHHIGLGVAAVGTLVLVLLFLQAGIM